MQLICIIKWLYNNWPDYSDCPDSEITEPAIDNGHLHILKWEYKKYYLDKTYIAKHAVQHNHLHIVKWLSSRRNMENQIIIKFAVEYGRLDILKWMAEIKQVEIYYESLVLAEETNQLQILKWIKKRNYT